MATDKKEFSQIDANRVAIALNVMFNNAVMYGGVHPSTRQNAVNLFTTLEPFFADYPEITFMRTGESLYMESFCVDSKVNPKRIITAFQRAGIESITFTSGLVADDCQNFIEIYSNLEIPTVDEKNSALLAKKISSIKFNYIFYQKVTKDDTVVNSSELETLATNLPTPGNSSLSNTLQYTPGQGDGTGEFVNQVGNLLSLKNVFDSSVLIDADAATVDGAKLVENIRKANRQVGGNPKIQLSADEMVESVLHATAELKQGISLQKEMGKIIKEEDLVINEIDHITYQTVVDLMCDEYKTGKISVKRLGRMIKKILPDIKEIKKIMPMLKEGLMAEGMELADFLQLTKELNRELSENEASVALAKGADELGLSVDDLVDALGDDPTEAAKLIVLASEIKQGGASNKNALSNLLTDYIEAASSDMAVNNVVEDSDGETVSKIITELENGILNKLKGQGVENSVVNDVKEELAKRFLKTVNTFKIDMIVNAISTGGDISSKQMKGIFGEKLPEKMELEAFQEKIETALTARGFTSSAADDFFSEITGKFKAPAKRIVLPKSVISTNNTKYFLQRYVKEYSRYKNPFSALNISPRLIIEHDGARPATVDDRPYVLPVLCEELKSQLRDLDIVGVIGDAEIDPIFVIMPMTDFEGTKIVLDRLRETLPKLEVQIEDKKVTVRFTVTALQYSKVVNPDSKSFIKHIFAKHKEMLAR